MVRKNIANDRLKNLRNSLVPSGEKPASPNQSVPERNIVPNQNDMITLPISREKKRKSDGAPEDYLSKRYKITNPVPVTSSRNNFRTETQTGFKCSNQQVGYEDNKTSKFEIPQVSVAHTSHPVIKMAEPIAGDSKKNNAKERLAKLRNNITKTGSSSCSNETELSPSIPHLFANKCIDESLSVEYIENNSISIEQNSMEYAGFADNMSPLYGRNASNNCTPHDTEKQSSIYSTLKSDSVTRLSKSNISSNVGKCSKNKHILKRLTVLNDCSPETPSGKYLFNDSVHTDSLSILGGKNVSPGKNSWRSNSSMSQRLSKYKDSGHCFLEAGTSNVFNLEDDSKSTPIQHQITLPEPPDQDVHMQECDSDSFVSCSENIATDTPKFEPAAPKNEDDFKKSEDICIVVDTNIFMAHLRIVKDIVNMPVSGSIKPLMYVPWMVVTELDFMKDGSVPGKSAQKAINYINSLLQAENCRIKCQTVFEVNEQVLVGKSPDDKIISCCLQVSEQFKTVILLSNDVNARNKALIHGIGTCSFNEIMTKLHGLLQKNRKFQKILHKMTIVCSYAICECAKDAYGDVWTKMDLLKDRPWSLSDCLRIFKKYWISVFGDKLLKQFQLAVNDLSSLLENKSSLADDTDDFKTFTAVCGAICFFLKDVESLRTMMDKTIKEIKNIKNS